VGAGDVVIDGYTALDIKQGVEAGKLPYSDETVDEVYASHVLEHVARADTIATLQEWVRVLKPGGIIRVAVPDMELWAKWVVEGRADFDMNGIVVGQLGPKLGNQIDQVRLYWSSTAWLAMPNATQRGHLGRVPTCGVHGQDEFHLPAQLIIATCCNLGHQVLGCEVEDLRRRRDNFRCVGLWDLAGKLVQQLWQVMFIGRCCQTYSAWCMCFSTRATSYRAIAHCPEGVIRANNQAPQQYHVDG
jgi:SAM-dependent methyltransferase